MDEGPQDEISIESAPCVHASPQFERGRGRYGDMRGEAGEGESIFEEL